MSHNEPNSEWLEFDRAWLRWHGHRSFRMPARRSSTVRVVSIRRACGIGLVALGGLLVFLGIGAMLSDTYDTDRWGHIVVGLAWAVPGVVLAYSGYLLARRR